MAQDLRFGTVTLENGGQIGPDEPVVVFTCRDGLLEPLLDYYASLLATNQYPEPLKVLNGRQADQVHDWQEANPGKVGTI
jgi:hypothetical protein